LVHGCGVTLAGEMRAIADLVLPTDSTYTFTSLSLQGRFELQSINYSLVIKRIH
jgi:hypothetical protein